MSLKRNQFNINLHKPAVILSHCALVVGIALTLGSLSVSEKAEAAIFKCVDANGNTSYNQTPCPTETKTEKVLAQSSSTKSSVDCRIANNFARQVATQMIAGSSSGRLFDSYGGIDAIPRTSVGVISYVYSHKGNKDNNVDRITSLSAARCSAGSYGSVSCDDFPHSFIAQLGGCELATKKTLLDQAVSDSKPTKSQPTAGAESVSMAVRTDNSSSCKDDVKTKLSALLADIQSGNGSVDAEEINKRKSALQQQMQSC